MISIELDFSEFIEKIENKDKHIIICMAESEAKEAEKIYEMTGCGQDYVYAVMGLIYFLRYSQKPYGIKEEHLQLFRVVCENLVAKKQLSSDALKMLDSKENYTRYKGII